MEIFNGTWSLDEIPEDFFEVLKILGYSGIARKYVQKNKLKFTSNIENDQLTIKFTSPFYSTVKQYKLTGEPTEYVDDKKNNILEVADWTDEKSIHIKSMYLEKGLTILNEKTLKNNNTECHHKMKLVSVEHPEIEVTLIYYKMTEEK